MKKIYIIIYIILILFFVTSGKSQYLHTEGKKIVNKNGEEILLRGIGLGGWLVPEGYQLHIPGFGSPTSIRNKIKNLIGETATDTFYKEYRANYVSEKDIERIASWGFNSIRLPFNYRLLSPEDQPGVFLKEGFETIDQLLNWCKQYELYLILDMHCAPGGQSKDNIADADGIEARLWTEHSNKERTIEIWEKLAERYKNDIWIGGYDLINEPVLPQGIPNTDLRLLYMNIVKAIREIDKNHIIFIEGNWYATDFTALSPPFDGNMVYSFHKYWNENTQNSIQSYVHLRNQYSIPLWMGESGENSNPWFYNCIQLLECNDIGWCWWTHKKVSTLTSPYSAEIPDAYQRILDYWNGSAPPPSQEAAVAGFSALAENLKLENCDYRPGVVKALLDQEFGTSAKPFSTHQIPGLIPAEDYDFGSIGISYLDTDYQNINGPGSGSTWNSGWIYRNDGVDVEESDDTQGTYYSVGWTEDGEWLLYTIEVELSTEYDIELRTAAPNNLGKCRLMLDDQYLTEIISIPASGDWKNWQTVLLDSIEIPSGKHQLTLSIIQGGFNINFIRFIRREPFIDESEFHAATDNISMGQSYPNPFREKVNIPVYIKEPEHYSLKIFNSIGKIVKDITPSFTQETGLQIIDWDGTDINNENVASGLYFYKISVGDKYKALQMILQR
ncbi:MAG: cellulase family glycosylhydrolase [bacterium]